MQTLNLVQGSAEWLAHRRQHFNASDAPAMLGCSPYKTRTQLLQELKTGIAPEIDASTQRRYDDGHRFEELARPLAEDVIGEDLEPVVGTAGKYSASFDGLTLAGDTAFEHKSLNDQLRAALMSDFGADALPKHYRVQMEQQLMVSGAERVLFMASKWDGDTLAEEMHAWYEADAELRAEISAGWQQFEKDLATFEPQAAVIEKVVAESVEALPAPIARATGELTVIDNFKEFEERLRRFLGRLIRDPKTDQDFADLDAQIKEIKRGREALKAARMQLRAQVEPIDRAEKTAEMLDGLMQENASMAQRILDGEKERRKGEIVAAGVSALDAHIAALNKRLGRPFMPKVPVDFGGATKGLKSLASMENKIDAALNQARLIANATADRIDCNLKHLNAEAGEYLALFPDLGALALKEPQDFVAQVQFRVAEQRAKDEKRAEAQREQIRQQERERAERLQREAQEAEEGLIRSIWAGARRIEQDRVPYIEKAIGMFETGARDWENDPRPRVAEAVAQAREEMRGKLDAAKTREQAAADHAAQVVQTAAATPPPAPVAAPVAPVRAAPPAAPAPAALATDGPATLLIGGINRRLGYDVSAVFLKHLGFEPARIDGARRFYRDSDLPLIGRAIAAHTLRVTALQADAA